METLAISNKQTEELRRSLREAAHRIDNRTHEVPAWVEYLKVILVDLEMYAMANDPNHPEHYEQMLRHLTKQSDARLKRGSWRTV